MRIQWFQIALCCKFITNKSESLIAFSFPERPWKKIGVDLFQLGNKNYLFVVDYYSRWIETPLLSSTKSESVISHMKSIFARLGIPIECHSDGGPQFDSYASSNFAKEYGFKHIFSSPHYPQSNGMAESAVKIVKTMLKKCQLSNEDPYAALLNYRSTPIKNGYSPAELIMGRKLRTEVPILSTNSIRTSLTGMSCPERRKNIVKSTSRTMTNIQERNRFRTSNLKRKYIWKMKRKRER